MARVLNEMESLTRKRKEKKKPCKFPNYMCTILLFDLKMTFLYVHRKSSEKRYTKLLMVLVWMMGIAVFLFLFSLIF